MMAFPIVRIDLRDFAPLTFLRNHRPLSRVTPLGTCSIQTSREAYQPTIEPCENGRIATRYSNLIDRSGDRKSQKKPRLGRRAYLASVKQTHPRRGLLISQNRSSIKFDQRSREAAGVGARETRFS